MNNRQAGRRRGRGGQRQGGNPGRPENGNRIDNRARGNAAQLLEKYKNLAADAQRQGDRVNTEYYLQFADHYFRVLSESRSRFEENRRQRDDAEDGDEEEFGFEGEPVTADAYQQAPQRREEGEPRREERAAREDRPRREDRPQREDRPGREERQPRRERLSQANGSEVNSTERQPREAANDGGEQPIEEAREPRRRGRPRRDAAPAVENDTLDANLLPPSLSLEPSNGSLDVAEEVAAEERPRRTRRRRAASEDEAIPPAA
jgi:hypothetical protein